MMHISRVYNEYQLHGLSEYYFCTMSTNLFEVRPRFTCTVSQSPAEIVENIKQILSLHQDKIVGRITHHHIRIRIVECKRHFWSPELSLSLEETGLGTEVRGMYGPKSDIWLAYMFGYFFLGFVIMIVSIVGLSRYNLGLSSYILWSVPFMLGGTFVLWITSRTGQRLGKDETELIHSLIIPAIVKQ